MQNNIIKFVIFLFFCMFFIDAFDVKPLVEEDIIKVECKGGCQVLTKAQIKLLRYNP